VRIGFAGQVGCEDRGSSVDGLLDRATTADGNLGEGFFLDLLRRGFSEEEARHQLKTAVDWGRYGEPFDFDADTGQLTLDQHGLAGH